MSPHWEAREATSPLPCKTGPPATRGTHLGQLAWAGRVLRARRPEPRRFPPQLDHQCGVVQTIDVPAGTSPGNGWLALCTTCNTCDSEQETGDRERLAARTDPMRWFEIVLPPLLYPGVPPSGYTRSRVRLVLAQFLRRTNVCLSVPLP